MSNNFDGCHDPDSSNHNPGENARKGIEGLKGAYWKHVPDKRNGLGTQGDMLYRGPFPELYAQHKEEIRRVIAGKRFIPRRDRDDVFQRVWISVLKALPSYSDLKGEGLTGLVFKIVHRRIIDVQRERSAGKRKSIKTESDFPEEFSVDLVAAANPSVLKRLISEDLVKIIKKETSNIGPGEDAAFTKNELDVLLGRLIADRPFHEIARALDISEGGAKNCYKKAKIKLRKILVQYTAYKRIYEAYQQKSKKTKKESDLEPGSDP